MSAGEDCAAVIEHQAVTAPLVVAAYPPDVRFIWRDLPTGGDFEGAVAHLRANGVIFRLEPMDTGVCQMAVFHDPDGNSLLLHRRKATT